VQEGGPEEYKRGERTFGTRHRLVVGHDHGEWKRGLLYA